ncbi:MAG: NAD-dependent epimerase/dehydratase family protein [Muribaculaceae bacterium]|nr:NAD-dependent epimerase/dehydratase family protein [Muribaculaceae bacterium]
MKTVYIIGGSGFIGKHLAVRLSSEYSVTVFDKFVDTDFFLNYPQINTVTIDLVEDKIPVDFTTPDFIINLASIVTAERDLSLFDALISTNLKILLNLYERFKEEENLKLFVQFGSSEEYGNIGSPFKESMREQPNSPYALVKQLTTNTALMLHSNYGFPSMVVRPGNLFGPGQNPAKFIPYITEKLKNNEPLEVTPCEQRRDFIHINDFSEAIVIILKSYKECVGEIINVSTGESISLKEIIETLRDSLNSASTIRYGALPYRENEAMDLRCETTKLDALRKKFILNNRIIELTK